MGREISVAPAVEHHRPVFIPPEAMLRIRKGVNDELETSVRRLSWRLLHIGPVEFATTLVPFLAKVIFSHGNIGK
jgi:hypothetical protein